MTNLPLIAQQGQDCWNQIGVRGDSTCPRLPEVVHCRNCDVLATAARHFFDRPAPAGYDAEWQEWLLEGCLETVETRISALIFRLHHEWFALDTRWLAEVTEPRPIHRIPHRSNRVLLGLVNIRGQLQLCVSLSGLFGHETPLPPGLVLGGTPTAAQGQDQQHGARTRLIVCGPPQARWVFPVAEVHGVEQIPRSKMLDIPSTLQALAGGFSQSAFSWQEATVGFLDAQRVGQALERLGP